MATLRTFEEKAAIVQHCVELEKEGGDILGYLWSENYLTPRATWCNFQREWLGRKPYEFTDGKPGKVKRKEKKMESRRAKITDEQRAEAVRIALDGGDPREYLEGLGFASGTSTWMKIKTYYRDTAPEVYKQIPRRLPTNGPKNKAAKKAETPETVLGKSRDEFEQMPAVKVDGPIRIETPEANRVQVVEVPEKVKKPITQPLCYDGMMVREIEGLFGRYRRSDIGGKIYVDFEITDGADILSYTVDQWKTMRAEQEKAFAVLGVEL